MVAAALLAFAVVAMWSLELSLSYVLSDRTPSLREIDDRIMADGGLIHLSQMAAILGRPIHVNEY